MSGWTTVTENTKPAPPTGWTPVQSIPPEAQPGGFWHEVIGTLGDALRGIPEVAARAVTGRTGELVGEMALQATLADQKRKEAGYSLPYRAVAGFGETALGIPASRMEAAAARGDTAGVLGAAAVPAALTLAGPAIEGAGKLRAASKLRTAGKLSEMAE